MYTLALTAQFIFPLSQLFFIYTAHINGAGQPQMLVRCLNQTGHASVNLRSTQNCCRSGSMDA